MVCVEVVNLGNTDSLLFIQLIVPLYSLYILFTVMCGDLPLFYLNLVLDIMYLSWMIIRGGSYSFRRIYLIQHKSEVFFCFQMFKARVETYFGKKMKILRDDGGGL